MTVWPFLVFAIIFAAMVCAHFALAYRAWWVSRRDQASDIDPNYVRLEDYFGRSFRARVSKWLNLPVQSAMPDGSMFIRKGRERIRVAPSVNFQPQSTSDDILVVRGTFECRAACQFGREIYVRGDASIGAETRLQSIAADGSMILGKGVQVARWVDSRGDLEIGVKSVVRARATAGGTLKLGEGAEVGSAFAAKVSTVRNGHREAAGAVEDPKPSISIPAGAAESKAGESWKANGFDPRRMTMLGANCCLYDGDFNPCESLRVKAKLIVKGDCTIPPGSVVESDIKARGSIQVGSGSVCHGNLISDGDIRFDAGSRFFGILHAGKTLRLSSGVCGGHADAQVAAFSADTLFIEDGVVVYGKVSSGTRVVAS